MKLSTLLDTNLIFLNQSFLSYDEVLKFLAEKFSCTTKLNSEKILHELKEREKLSSTFLGDMTSLPHNKFDNFNDLKIAIVTLKDPITIKTESGNDSLKYIISIISPKTKPDIYIKVLNALSTLLINNKEILNTDSASGLIKDVENLGIKTGHTITAKDLLSEYPTISKESTIEEALAILKQKKLDTIPVVENNKPIGLLGITDIIKNVMPEYILSFEDFSFVNSDFQPLELLWKNEKNMDVPNVSNNNIQNFIVTEDTLYPEIFFLITKNNFPYLIVVDNKNNFKGIIEPQTILNKILLP